MARILVADDDQATRDMIRRALEGGGHSVLVASDGGEAAKIFETEEPVDLLIADVSMPQLDGIALSERVRANAPSTRIIIMSGMADELSRAQSLADDGVRLLNKPVSLEQIRKEVAEIMG